MKLFYKKKIATFLVLLVTVPQFLYAQSPVVSDPTNLVQNTMSAIAEAWQVTKDMGLDPIVYQLAAMAGNKMSNAVFNNAAGGAAGDGESQVISNFTELLQKVDDKQRAKFISALEADAKSAKGSPYAAKIAKKFTEQGQKLGKTGESLVPKFNLPQIAGPNWKNAGTDIKSAGGWNTYIAVALPQNNPYGAEILQAEELARKIGLEREAEKLKLTSLGLNPSANAKCGLTLKQYNAQISKKIGSGPLTAENSKKIADIDSQIAALEQQGRASSPLVLVNPEISPDIQKKINTLNAQKASIYITVDENKFGVEGLDNPACLEEIIKNPVSTSVSLLDSAANYAIDKSKNSQGAGDFFLSIFMTMGQSFLRGGLSSFQNQGSKYLRPIDPSIIGGPEDQVDSQGNNRPINEQPFQVIDLATDFPHAYTLTKQDITKTNEVLKELRKTPNILASLDICVPGPDYKYNERFDKYYQEKLQIPYGVYARAEEDWERAREEAKIKDLEYSKKLVVSEMKSIVNDPVYNIPGATIFKSAVSEFSSKKNAFDQNRRSLIEKNSSLSVILSISQSIKSILERISQKEGKVLFSNSKNMEADNIVISSQDWEALKDNPAKKKQLVEWAKSFEPKTEPVNLLDTAVATEPPPAV